MEGWVKLHRKLINNPIFKNANLYHLYSYCLLKARHDHGEAIFGDVIIKLAPGEFVTGRNVLSEALNEKPNTTYKRLKKLEKLNYVSLKSNNKNTVVTVLNWDSYQVKKEEVTTESQQSNNKVTTESQQSNTNKNVKNEEEKNILAIAEKLYELYPVKNKGKKLTNKAKKVIKEHGYDVLAKCIKLYTNNIKKNNTEDQYVKGFAPFLGETYYDYLELATLGTPVVKKKPIKIVVCDRERA